MLSPLSALHYALQASVVICGNVHLYYSIMAKPTCNNAGLQEESQCYNQ